MPKILFKPGHSGNPGGRPRGLHQVAELAKRHTPEAFAALVHVLKNGKSEAARIAAAVSILDRGWGRPVQAIEGAEGSNLIPVLNVRSAAMEKPGRNG